MKEETKPSPAAPKARKSSRTGQTQAKGSTAAPQPKSKASAPAKRPQPPPRSRTVKNGGPGLPPAKETGTSTPQERLSIAELAVQAGKQAAVASAEKKVAKVAACAMKRLKAGLALRRPML